MLFGEFNQQTDEKGRVRIPAKLKPALGENIMIAKGTNHCLFLIPQEQLEILKEKITNISMFDAGVQLALRTFTSGIDQLEEDNQGRSLLPKNLREYAQIKKDIVFIGVGNRAELWAKEVYDEYFKASSTNYEKTLAELHKYGI